MLPIRRQKKLLNKQKNNKLTHLFIIPKYIENNTHNYEFLIKVYTLLDGIFVSSLQNRIHQFLSQQGKECEDQLQQTPA